MAELAAIPLPPRDRPFKLVKAQALGGFVSPTSSKIGILSGSHGLGGGRGGNKFYSADNTNEEEASQSLIGNKQKILAYFCSSEKCDLQLARNYLSLLLFNLTTCSEKL